MKKIKSLLLIALVLLGLLFYVFFSDNIRNHDYKLRIEDDISVESLMDSFEKYKVLNSTATFKLNSKLRGLERVPAGFYRFNKKKSNFDIVSKLKHGFQDPVRFTLSTATYLSDIIQKASVKMKFDSTELSNFILSDSSMNRYGYNKNTAIAIFLPNTYELYWNTSVEKFTEKMYKENQKFWNEDRRGKSNDLNLTIMEVYTLSSLVQKEYYKREERSKIAGVIINRLNKGQKLQIDATCKYATGDFAAKRVLNKHISFNSPYNTYQVLGLPKGPICVPELSTIDACLSPDSHNYYYYCADPSLNGYHIFSQTLSEHEQVARDYRAKMNKMKIY